MTEDRFPDGCCWAPLAVDQVEITEMALRRTQSFLSWRGRGHWRSSQVPGFHPHGVVVGSERTAAAATSVIETEVYTWDVYSSVAEGGLANSGLEPDEVKAGTAVDQRIRGKVLPSNVTSEGRRQIS